MNRFLQRLILPAAALVVLPAYINAATPVAPNVPVGSFHCFRGMPQSEINYIEQPEGATIRKIDRLGNSKWDNTDGHDLRSVPTEGDYKVLVIVVNFKDMKFSQDKNDPRGLVSRMLNDENFTFQNATGSANQFYRAASGGQFNPIFNVYGPVELAKESKEYVSPIVTPEANPDMYYTDANGKQQQKYPASLMIEEAIRAVDDQVNFADYDSNGDGLVDFVYVFYAGKGATTGGNRDTTVWPHAFTLTAGLGAPIELDGVTIDRYACSSELGTDNKLSGIGTFCHEFGHVLGLPDLYDTANNGSTTANFTPGTFSYMDAGNYNNSEHTPPYASAYEQYSLEWMLPTTVTGGGTFTLLPVGARKFAYKFNTSNPQEYFLMEARDKYNYDYYLECHGLAVWHIDFDADIWDKNIPNNNDSHHRIDLIEADNDRQATSRHGDLFPGSAAVCEYTDNVTPTFTDWNHRSTGYNITEINRNFDGSVTFLCTAAAGNEMEGSVIPAPAVDIVATTDNSINALLHAVDGAKTYYVSVFPSDKFDRAYLTEYLPGWYYRQVTPDEDGLINISVEGLDTGREYGIMAYAANDVNASRSVAPAYARTVASDFATAVTDLQVRADASEEGAALLSWTTVPEADSYDLFIGTRAASASSAEGLEAVHVDFADRLPEGWSGTGKIDNRERYSGEAAPSYQLGTNGTEHRELGGSGAYLLSPDFGKLISRITFWARKHYTDELSHFEIYGVTPEGTLIHAATITDLAKDGKTHSVEMPGGCTAFKISYFFRSSGLDANIDDIVVEFTDGFVDTPAPEAQIALIGNNGARLTGLNPDTKYVAYVTPKKGDTPGLRSAEIVFTPSTVQVSDVENVEIDNDSDIQCANGVIRCNDPFSVYTADGKCLASGIRGAFKLTDTGIFIVTSGLKTIKVVR